MAEVHFRHNRQIGPAKLTGNNGDNGLMQRLALIHRVELRTGEERPAIWSKIPCIP